MLAPLNAVTRRIHSLLWPALKSVGFTSFASRVAWRYVDDRVDVLEVPAISRTAAESAGLTTLSFGVKLGCYLLYIPYERCESIDGRLAPREYQCPLRAHGLLEPRVARANAQMQDVWSVDCRRRGR